MDPICKPFIIHLGDIAPLRGGINKRGALIRGRRLFNIVLLNGGVKKKGAFIRGFTVVEVFFRADEIQLYLIDINIIGSRSYYSKLCH